MIRTTRPPSVHSIAAEQGDPLSVIMRPPLVETSDDRSARLQREANAKKISDSIDEAIKQDRERYKKSKEDVKVSAHSHCVRLRLLRWRRETTSLLRGTRCKSGAACGIIGWANPSVRIFRELERKS